MENTENRFVNTRRQNPITFYLRTLLYMFMALLMRVVALLPLMALGVFPAESPLRWLALLCPLLLIFWILPFRFSFAQALIQRPRERNFSLDKATSASNYGEKLAEGLLHLLNVAKWGIPLAAALIACYFYVKNVDAISLLSNITDLGKNSSIICTAVSNFFAGIFGGMRLVPDGSLIEGLYTIAAVLSVGMLILLWGAMRNSAYRYIWAAASRDEKNPRAEARRRLRGRRSRQLVVALINLVLWMPALFVVVVTLKGVTNDIADALLKMFTTHKLDIVNFTDAILPLLFALVVCYMPLLPVRRMLTAYFATRQLRHKPVISAPVMQEAAVTEAAIAQQAAMESQYAGMNAAEAEAMEDVDVYTFDTAQYEAAQPQEVQTEEAQPTYPAPQATVLNDVIKAHDALYDEEKKPADEDI